MTRQTFTVLVTESRRVVIDLPPEVPIGPVVLEIRVAGKDRVTEIPPAELDVGTLPKYFDSQLGEWRLVGRSGVVREVSGGRQGTHHDSDG